MTLTRRSFNAIAATGLAASTFGLKAQTPYPNKPIRWIHGTPAGGGSDVLVRVVAEQVSRQIEQPVLIENKPGAGTSIAAEYVARAPADGYTLLSADIGTLVFNTALYKKLSYVPAKDLQAIGMLAHFPLLLVAAPNGEFTTAAAALTAIRANPGKYTCGTSGIGSPHHLALELLKDDAALDLVHVPYKGGAPSLQDVVAGMIPFAVVDSATSAGMRAAGRLRVLASFTQGRVEVLPGVPTLIELGYLKSAAPCWVSVVAPAGTPADVVTRLSTEVARAVTTAPVQKRLRELGLEPQGSTAAELREVWAMADKQWPPMIRAKGISVE